MTSERSAKPIFYDCLCSMWDYICQKSWYDKRFYLARKDWKWIVFKLIQLQSIDIPRPSKHDRLTLPTCTNCDVRKIRIY